MKTLEILIACLILVLFVIGIVDACSFVAAGSKKVQDLIASRLKVCLDFTALAFALLFYSYITCAIGIVAVLIYAVILLCLSAYTKGRADARDG